MGKLRPPDIVEVAEARDDLVRKEAERKARARGLSRAKAKVAGERAVQKYQREEPRVTAEGWTDADDGAVFACFWARLFLNRSLWRIEGTLAHDLYGRVVVRKLSLEPWVGDLAEPSAEVLRSLSVTLLKDIALRELRNRGAAMPDLRDQEKRSGGRFVVDVSEDEEASMLRAAELAGPPTPRRGRRGGGDDFYRGVARDAVRIAGAGLPIYATLAEERGVSPETARKWIAKTRQASHGFLDSGPNVWRFGPNYERKEQK